MQIRNFTADVKTSFCISGKHLISNRYFGCPNKWYQLLNTEAETCRSDAFLFCIRTRPMLLQCVCSCPHLLLLCSKSLLLNWEHDWKLLLRAIPSFLEKFRSWKGELDGSKDRTGIPSVSLSDKVIKIESWKFNMGFSRDPESVLWNFAV